MRCQYKRFGFACERSATVGDYCWQHDPERGRAAALEARKQLAIKTAADDAAFEARHARKKLLADSGVDRLTDSDLRLIIARGGIEALLLSTL